MRDSLTCPFVKITLQKTGQIRLSHMVTSPLPFLITDPAGVCCSTYADACQTNRSSSGSGNEGQPDLPLRENYSGVEMRDSLTCPFVKITLQKTGQIRLSH